MNSNAIPLAMTQSELTIPTGKTIDVEDASGLKLAGVAISATAAELNANGGVTAGTGLASKALVLGASATTIPGDITFNDGTTDIDIASHDATNGLKLAGTLVTSSAAEINENDMTGSVGTVAGTNITVTETGNKVMHKSLFR